MEMERSRESSEVLSSQFVETFAVIGEVVYALVEVKKDD